MHGVYVWVEAVCESFWVVGMRIWGQTQHAKEHVHRAKTRKQSAVCKRLSVSHGSFDQVCAHLFSSFTSLLAMLGLKKTTRSFGKETKAQRPNITSRHLVASFFYFLPPLLRSRPPPSPLHTPHHDQPNSRHPAQFRGALFPCCFKMPNNALLGPSLPPDSSSVVSNPCLAELHSPAK